MRCSMLVRLCDGEERLLPVARAVQTDHQAVADQLVVAHAFDGDQFLQARRRGELAEAERARG